MMGTIPSRKQNIYKQDVVDCKWKTPARPTQTYKKGIWLRS